MHMHNKHRCISTYNHAANTHNTQQHNPRYANTNNLTAAHTQMLGGKESYIHIYIYVYIYIASHTHMTKGDTRHTAAQRCDHTHDSTHLPPTAMTHIPSHHNGWVPLHPQLSSGGAKCRFGTASVVATIVNATRLVCVAPSGLLATSAAHMRVQVAIRYLSL